jgi:hypothetical protein
MTRRSTASAVGLAVASRTPRSDGRPARSGGGPVTQRWVGRVHQALVEQGMNRLEGRARQRRRAADEPSFAWSRNLLVDCPHAPGGDDRWRLPSAAALAKQRDLGVDEASKISDRRSSFQSPTSPIRTRRGRFCSMVNTFRVRPFRGSSPFAGRVAGVMRCSRALVPRCRGYQRRRGSRWWPVARSVTALRAPRAELGRAARPAAGRSW